MKIDPSLCRWTSMGGVDVHTGHLEKYSGVPKNNSASDYVSPIGDANDTRDKTTTNRY